MNGRTLSENMNFNKGGNMKHLVPLLAVLLLFGQIVFAQSDSLTTKNTVTGKVFRSENTLRDGSIEVVEYAFYKNGNFSVSAYLKATKDDAVPEFEPNNYYSGKYAIAGNEIILAWEKTILVKQALLASKIEWIKENEFKLSTKGGDCDFKYYCKAE